MPPYQISLLSKTFFSNNSLTDSHHEWVPWRVEDELNVCARSIRSKSLHYGPSDDAPRAARSGPRVAHGTSTDATTYCRLGIAHWSESVAHNDMCWRKHFSFVLMCSIQFFNFLCSTHSQIQHANIGASGGMLLANMERHGEKIFVCNFTYYVSLTHFTAFHLTRLHNNFHSWVSLHRLLHDQYNANGSTRFLLSGAIFFAAKVRAENHKIFSCSYTWHLFWGGEHLSAAFAARADRSGECQANADNCLHHKRIQGVWGWRWWEIRAKLALLDRYELQFEVFSVRKYNSHRIRTKQVPVVSTGICRRVLAWDESRSTNVSAKPL